MSTYAIIKTGGKQVKVGAYGQADLRWKINAGKLTEVTLTKLFCGDKVAVVLQLLRELTVVGTIEKQGKQKKVVT